MDQNGFINQQIEEIKKGNKKAILILWVAAGLIWAYRLISPGVTLIIGGIPITSLFVAVPLPVLAAGVTIWQLIQNKKDLFDLRDGEVKPDAAKETIEQEVRRGEILLEQYARPTEQQDSLKFILLPSYLLVRNLKLVAIPTKNITGVSFKFERGKSDAVTYAHYQISTRETTHMFDVNFAEEAYSQNLVDALGAFIKSINQGDQRHAL